MQVNTRDEKKIKSLSETQVASSIYIFWRATEASLYKHKKATRGREKLDCDRRTWQWPLEIATCKIVLPFLFDSWRRWLLPKTSSKYVKAWQWLNLKTRWNTVPKSHFVRTRNDGRAEATKILEDCNISFHGSKMQRGVNKVIKLHGKWQRPSPALEASSLSPNVFSYKHNARKSRPSKFVQKKVMYVSQKLIKPFLKTKKSPWLCHQLHGRRCPISSNNSICDFINSVRTYLSFRNCYI